MINKTTRLSNSRLGLDRHDSKLRQSTEEIIPRNSFPNKDSPRSKNTKLDFSMPGRGDQPLGDPEVDIDENGDCIQRPFPVKRNSLNKKKSIRSLSGQNRKLTQEGPEVFLDALDYAYDPSVPADTRFKDMVTPKDVKYPIVYMDLKPEEFASFLKKFKYVEDKDDTRASWAYPKGGVACREDVMTKFRNIAKSVMHEFGRKLLSGNFNLTTVSFPIKSMIAESFLEKCTAITGLYPLYLNLAMMTKDPMERFKFVVASSVAIFCYLEAFAKPLNPILGESFEAGYPDGTELFAEQISHHPPISYLLVYGPNKGYMMNGTFIAEATGGLNSLKVLTKGRRKINFLDQRQEISIQSTHDMMDGTFIGRCVHSVFGSFQATDEKNDIRCNIIFGKVKNKLVDYYEGEITQGGKVVSKISGTYLGWMEIGGKRYWDHRYISPFKLHKHKSKLGSDSNYRPDLLTLALGEVEKAQKEKESLEQLQRYDRKLRKEHKEALAKKKA